MEIIIGDVIRKKRHELNIKQESLAEALGVTVQAVSKWENGLSNPEIATIVKISEYLNITLDELFYGIKEEKNIGLSVSVPNDNKLRIIQCIGTRVLRRDEYKKGERIELVIPEDLKNITDVKTVNYEIWGNAKIDGYIYGNVGTGTELYCDNVIGSAEAGTALICSNVGGNATAGTEMTCAHVGGSAVAGGALTCGNIGADASAGTYIDCKEIYGSAKAGSYIKCGGNIGGDATCDSISGMNTEITYSNPIKK